MSVHPTSLRIGDHTLTYEHFSQQGREERRRLARDLVDRVREVDDSLRELRESILREVGEQFAPQYEGIPRNLPVRLTKSGQPDRRRGFYTNPKWHAVNQRELSTREEMLQSVVEPPRTHRWIGDFERTLLDWEISLETPAEEFERLLASTDWYSAYSDDHSVWAAGEGRQRRLQDLIRQLGPEAQLAYNRACPWLDEDGNRKAAA